MDTLSPTQGYTRPHTWIHSAPHMDTLGPTQGYTVNRDTLNNKQGYTWPHTGIHSTVSSHCDTLGPTQGYTRPHTGIHLAPHRDTPGPQAEMMCEHSLWSPAPGRLSCEGGNTTARPAGRGLHVAEVGTGGH
jgi:hypothetical protein